MQRCTCRQPNQIRKQSAGRLSRDMELKGSRLRAVEDPRRLKLLPIAKIKGALDGDFGRSTQPPPQALGFEGIDDLESSLHNGLGSRHGAQCVEMSRLPKNAASRGQDSRAFADRARSLARRSHPARPGPVDSADEAQRSSTAHDRAVTLHRRHRVDDREMRP